MSTDRSGGAPSLDQRRQQVVEDLMEHFANDVLDLTEFERRLDVANGSGTIEELNALVGDLPTAGGGGALVRSSKLTPARGGPPTVVSTDQVPERSLMLAMCGGTARKGRWVPARKNRAIALMGGVELDFRDAMLGPGVTEVDVFALLGGVEIIVPPEMAVQVDGMAILGGFENESDAPLNRSPEEPLLKIRGLIVLGGAEIAVRLPGESKRDTKKRKRLERRAMRELKSDWEG